MLYFLSYCNECLCEFVLETVLNSLTDNSGITKLTIIMKMHNAPFSRLCNDNYLTAYIIVYTYFRLYTINLTYLEALINLRLEFVNCL